MTRYLNSDSLYRKSDNTVKPRAFEPNSISNPPSLSVFRIHGLEDLDIWNIGRNVLNNSQNPHLHGRADILVSVVQQQGLHINPDNIPPRHANIIDWPVKEKWKSISQELAAAATLHLLEK